MWGQNRFENVTASTADELLFANSAYADAFGHHGHVQNVFDSHGFRILKVHSDPTTGLKILFYVPAWFPSSRAQHGFAYHRLPATITLGVVFRGTNRNLIGNIKADFELVWNKLYQSNLPALAMDAAHQVHQLIDWIHTTHPAIKAAGSSLKIQFCGHSLGGFLAEACAVNLTTCNSMVHMEWSCTTFESPGLPHEFLELATAVRPHAAWWEQRITTYLAAPNPINMLHRHLGRVVHVRIPFELTVSHVARCVTADASRMWLMAAAATTAAATLQTAVAGAAVGSAAGGVGVSVGGSEAGGLAAVKMTLEAAQKLLFTGVSAAGGVEALLGVSSALTSILGVEVSELMEQHDLSAMMPCFDMDSGEIMGEYRQEMQEWPFLGALPTTLHSSLLLLAKSLLPSFICPTNVGVANLMDRQAMIQRRIRAVPGFVPREAAAGTSQADAASCRTLPHAIAAAAISPVGHVPVTEVQGPTAAPVGGGAAAAGGLLAGPGGGSTSQREQLTAGGTGAGSSAGGVQGFVRQLGYAKRRRLESVSGLAEAGSRLTGALASNLQYLRAGYAAARNS